MFEVFNGIILGVSMLFYGVNKFVLGVNRLFYEYLWALIGCFLLTCETFKYGGFGYGGGGAGVPPFGGKVVVDL